MSSKDRAISPPPLKRRRVDKPQPVHLAPSLPPRPFTDLKANHFRIFSWNINGISPFLQPSITSFFKTTRKRGQTPPTDDENQNYSFRTYLARWKWPQVVGLQEIKIRPGDDQTMSRVRQAVKATGTDPGYRAYFSLPRDKYNAKGFGGKVYGVAMFVREDVVGTVTDLEWDLEGRVLLLKVPKAKLTVFNVYAVNGTDNPYRNSKTGNVEGTRHDKKRRFHSELAEAVRDLENDGWTVVVAGDINIARYPVDGFPGIRLGAAHVENRADFEAKFMSEGLAMVDTFRRLHDQERKYSYRGRNIEWGASCDRVDLVLTSSTAKDAITEADILDTALERGPSDHVPIYATIDLEKLTSSPELASEDS